MSSASNDNKDMTGKAKEDFNRAAQRQQEPDKPAPALDREPPKHQLRQGGEFDRQGSLRAARERAVNHRCMTRRPGLSLG